MPGSWAHLARRFFWTLRAAPLTDAERVEVSALVTPELAALFFAQDPADQRHGLDAVRHVRAAGGETEMQRAALLHDVGKRHAGLGVIGRSLASAAARLRVPVRGRFHTYLDHPDIGAGELSHHGAEALVVEFARHHHRTRPPTITPDTWEILVRSDEVFGGGRPAG